MPLPSEPILDGDSDLVTDNDTSILNPAAVSETHENVDPLALSSDDDLDILVPEEDPMVLFPDPDPGQDPLTALSAARTEDAVEDMRMGVADVGIETRDARESSLPLVDDLRTIMRDDLKLEPQVSKEDGQNIVTAVSAEEAEPAPVEPTEESKMTDAQWLRLVNKYGDPDPESILFSGSEDEFSTAVSLIDYSICRVDPKDQPPFERRGEATRQFDCRLVDEWNRMAPRLTKNPDLHRMIFAAYIAQSELESGEIKVINDVDEEGAPPDFEFDCSNDMLYHPDVPDPELSLGCGCEGPCDPNSSTCSCVKRQELYFYDMGIKGFAYDE